MEDGEEGVLILQFGDPLKGASFGSSTKSAGEVVFFTGMVGYVETLTDPSYRGQILLLTYPLIGNYGVPDVAERDTFGLPKRTESTKIQVAGLIVSECCELFSHWEAKESLQSWLRREGVPAIQGVDTRRLTKLIRDAGSMLGVLDCSTRRAAKESVSFWNPNESHLVAEVSSKDIVTYGGGGDDAWKPNILLIDCGAKVSIVRQLLCKGTRITTVPHDYPLQQNPAKIVFDGVLLGNGPGDPCLAVETIESVSWLMKDPSMSRIPILGICLGSQILALAAGGKTFKMKYGNRGANQPCIDLRSERGYITSQNHGYAVDHTSLPSEWKALFVNANDLTNEGIMHTSKPYMGVQFHPEASSGPTDTLWIFDSFIDAARIKPECFPHSLRLHSPEEYSRHPVRRVLLVGSGGLSIGQAGEFDYSGSQAIKALKEEGLEVIVLNPNIATVQTSAHKGYPSADKTYFLPIRASVIEDILARDRPDGVLFTFGGQSALSVGISLWHDGTLQKYGCRVLGTPIESIVVTEDRGKFSAELKSINERLAPGSSVSSVGEAISTANMVGYPVLVRCGYSLGGLGSGFASNETELQELTNRAFQKASQVSIDKDLRGWKEIEVEVVRDCKDNCIAVCVMENFDPLGVHTGDSIVVAPSQTLNDKEYFMLRETSIKVIRFLGIVGECNIQFALSPNSREYVIVEVNARLSRSSALASKATGFPLAYVAAKLALGISLVQLRNPINGSTSLCFEPSLDYVVVKMPRWDLAKFRRVSTKLGSSMLSVGEVMAVGRSLEEAIQKAVRMVGNCRGLPKDGLDGFDDDDDGLDPGMSGEELENLLRFPTENRIYALQTALERGYSEDVLHDLTGIDRWFLFKLKHIAVLKHKLTLMRLESLNESLLLEAKKNGFSDSQLARYLSCRESDVRRLRQQFSIFPVAKQIDTMAGEVACNTNYIYLTYHGTENDCVNSFAAPTKLQENDVPVRRVRSHSTPLLPSQTVFKSSKQLKPMSSVLVLGCGAYCIGSSVEFDWCAVSCLRESRLLGHRAIMINCNPETVSTDYDESDALYFEELSLERVLDIVDIENASERGSRIAGVIVSMGGQLPNNLALPLASSGLPLLGTSAACIVAAEDRNQFSALLDRLQVDQPPWQELSTVDAALEFASDVGYPVLVRPSFVLSGAAMRVCSSPCELKKGLTEAGIVSPAHPVVLSKFIEGAKEIEFDGVASGGSLLNFAISEHIENAGVHSGDACLVLPAQKLYVQTVRRIKYVASKIAEELSITGPFNVQFLAKGNEVKVIECNLRASRTFPFVSKTFGCNFIDLATAVILGYDAKPFQISLFDMDFVCVKAPQFSFPRLCGADPTLGVEMASTGEVACFGRSLPEAFLQALLSANFILPQKVKEKSILLSIAQESSRVAFLDSVAMLQAMGYELAGTPGTSCYYEGHGIRIKSLEKPTAAGEPQCEAPDSVLGAIRLGQIGLVINLPEATRRTDEITAGYRMRRAAIDSGISVMTNLKCAVLLVEALWRLENGKLEFLQTRRGRRKDDSEATLPTLAREEFSL